ncbi:hypothetical protein MMON_53590 [Mycolicibacterium monacense]|uniref:Uncharacterized protein n=1 Tax=Mycolicibacterium monacense TaxID=85693 RepID=A0AAD1N031_MYCMB|nr:hypothetical protein MMON_53590 [Mycolicibacterium monacense]
MDNRTAALRVSVRQRFGISRVIRIANATPRKRDDPRQGGEEAEVVVYQPRGVGLMHTRHNPGNAHYTHGTATECKSRMPEKLLIRLNIAHSDTCLDLPICTPGTPDVTTFVFMLAR